MNNLYCVYDLYRKICFCFACDHTVTSYVQTIRYHFSMNVAEILDPLENNFGIGDYYVGDIFIELPDVAQFTDEDQADEDEKGILENLNGRQLQVPAILAAVQHRLQS